VTARLRQDFTLRAGVVLTPMATIKPPERGTHVAAFRVGDSVIRMCVSAEAIRALPGLFEVRCAD